MASRTLSNARPRLLARPRKPAHAVKSAMRALEILEYFDDVQSEAPVLQVAAALGYPQSSTSALLRTLLVAGYLHYNPQRRTYITSARATFLGSWVGTNFAREGRAIELMRALNEETGDTIVLASRNGIYSQYIHVVQATSVARLHMSIGTVRSLASSGTGLVFLSALSDGEITRVVNRIIAERIAPGVSTSPREVLAKVEEIRRLGYSFSTDLVTQGGGMLAAALPRSKDHPMLVIGIGGISQNMIANRDKLVATLMSHLAEYKRGV